MAAYGRAWETADPDAVVELFTEDATYRETPFDEAISGPEAIHAYWSEIPRYHRDVSFTWEVLDVREDLAFVHWRRRTRLCEREPRRPWTGSSCWTSTGPPDGAVRFESGGTSVRRWAPDLPPLG